MECADLIVDLSPPSSNQAVSPDLSPSEYIHHPSMLSLIRQKSSLDIGPKTHKRCYLEPAPIETDQTIAQYYNRVFESVFKANLSVRIPGEGIVQMFCDGQGYKKALATIYIELNSLKEAHGKRILELATEIITLRTENTTLRTENITLRDRIEEQDKRMAVQDKRMEVQDMRMAVQDMRMAVQDRARFKMFKANILVDLVKKVYVDLHLDYLGNLEERKDTKKTRNAQAALSLNERQLEAFFKNDGKRFGPEYYKVLQNITQYIGARNETAHETYIDFAVLLHSDAYREKGDYRKRANLFPLVYGKSVAVIVEEEVAAYENELLEEGEWGP